jgi:hypothetical protein
MSATNVTPGEKIARPPSAAPDVGLPARLNMKRAFDVYVAGRSRSLGPLDKGALVGGQVETPFPQASAQDVRRDPVLQVSKVSVPAVLRFDRNAGTWRSLEDPPKGGSR